MSESTTHIGSPKYICDIHGAVVGYTPFQYVEAGGFQHPVGVYCPMCINDWYARTFKALKPFESAGAGRA
jgi:hypothetical protein